MFSFAAIVLGKIDVKWFCVVKGNIVLLCVRAYKCEFFGNKQPKPIGMVVVAQ